MADMRTPSGYWAKYFLCPFSFGSENVHLYRDNNKVYKTICYSYSYRNIDKNILLKTFTFPIGVAICF